MHWKIARDPYLAPVCARDGDDAAFDAGFFLDDDPDDARLDDVDWLCTPTAHVRRAIASRRVREPVVLLSTGGFYPVHGGHLEMMASARAAVVAAGADVVGGYLSPGHDQYLTLKCGADAQPAPTRLAQAAGAVAHLDWLAVDPWEALARRGSVNYTDVTARLEHYLRAHVDPRIEVVFVCGGDNARFALAFSERGRCVVVERPGGDGEVARWQADPRVAGNARILWALGTNPASSRDLRPQPVPAAPEVLHLRLETAASVRTLALPPTRWTAFQHELVQLVREHVDVVERPVAAAPPEGVISLDPLVPGEVNLGVSRCYDLGGCRVLSHVARPGWPPLADQVASVPPGRRWTLRDDDRATGATLAFAANLLSEVGEIAAFEIGLDQPAGEIADSRDFLLGTDDGGLVVALPDGTIARAPYLLPYVDPAARAGFPASRVHELSAAIWRLNARTFAGTDTRVADLPLAARATMRAAGFAPGEGLVDVCERHATALDGLRAPAPRG